MLVSVEWSYSETKTDIYFQDELLYVSGSGFQLYKMQLLSLVADSHLWRELSFQLWEGITTFAFVRTSRQWWRIEVNKMQNSKVLLRWIWRPNGVQSLLTLSLSSTGLPWTTSALSPFITKFGKPLNPSLQMSKLRPFHPERRLLRSGWLPYLFFYTCLEVPTAPWGEFQCRRFEAALNVTPSRVHFRRASLGLLWYAWPKQPPRGYHAPCVERTFHVAHHKSLTTSEFYPLSRVQI